MTEDTKKTSERIIPDNFKSKEEYLLYLRHLFAYEFASRAFPKDCCCLEVGCGEGYGTSLLSKYVKEIIGLDVDNEIIMHAQKKYRTANCYFILYDGEKIPFEDYKFDGVISFQVIEHIEDDKRFVSEIHRVLKENGIFILTTPNRTYRLKPRQKPWNPFHVREYYPLELDNLLKSVFHEVKVLGIRGTEEVQKIEKNRVKLSSNFPNLKKFLPDSSKRKLVDIISKRKTTTQDFRAKYSIKDFDVTDDVTQSLDLLGVCKK